MISQKIYESNNSKRTFWYVFKILKVFGCIKFVFYSFSFQICFLKEQLHRGRLHCLGRTKKISIAVKKFTLKPEPLTITVRIENRASTNQTAALAFRQKKPKLLQTETDCLRAERNQFCGQVRNKTISLPITQNFAKSISQTRISRSICHTESCLRNA